ncbi:MAG: phosphonoacetaldehyde hydrolase [Merdimonas faecis]|jgi:phosphonoacetaldehyde hydrolase|uniref:Phosphonoacetaldehyde hydrolase n=1 Tax=Merdimonas faecis TaxID=1653435 RepID=A0A9D2VY15_9FIRM|nr:phosphonoacetaldehyde hydrolase [Merdimonas faecis]HJH49796.1 phosphonoacetaldehyde hydrolase [Merdimonas faecis]
MNHPSLKQIEAVVFDWAGTTVDFGCFAPVQAFVEVFKQYGVEPTMEEVREPMGMLKIDHIRTMLKMPRIHQCWVEKYGKEPGEEEAQQLFSIFEEKLLSILHLYADPKPGVVETVNALKEKGIRIGSTTGYTDKMMEIIIPITREKGYEPECWFSPDSTGQKGRPYPYMIFRNMETLGIDDVRKVLKVGDTASDIKEGKHAGVWSAGVIVGSSEMGLTEEEYEALSPEEKEAKCKETEEKFRKAGADIVFRTLEELKVALI